MKKYYSLKLAALVVCIVSLNAQAQEQVINTGMGVGFQINQYQNDFGVGLSLTTPYFVHEKIAVRLKGNFMFNETIENSLTTWAPYSNVQLGLIGVGGMVGEQIRLYGEGGFVGLFPSDIFSSEQFVFGGYGLFGFEFFMSPRRNYFIEIGAIGTGATEDKIATQPIYSNGLMISTGFRVNFK